VAWFQLFQAAASLPVHDPQPLSAAQAPLLCSAWSAAMSLRVATLLRATTRVADRLTICVHGVYRLLVSLVFVYRRCCDSFRG
jgi:hypothetical protein